MALGVIVVPEEKPFIKALESYTAKFSNLSSGKNTVAIGLDTRNATKALGQISGNVKNFEASLAASNARVIAFGASTAVLGGVIAGFKELANATVEVEKSLTDVNRVFGLTSAGLQKLSTDLFEVSKITASSFKDASQALLEFSRQGVPAAEALQRTKDALTLTRLAGVETGAAVESLTAAVNGFSASGLNTTQILNKLVAVEQNYAVSAGDLSEALSRTGQAAQEAGVDINQLNALVTAAQQNTARGGAVIGNALKTIFTRIQRGGTLDQLEAFNVTVRDVAGNVLPAVEILKNFAAVYKDLGTSQKSQLSEQIAGIYQVNILKALIKDLNSENSVYAGSLEIGANATNEAEVATAKLNSTLSALFSRVGTGSTQLLNNIGKVTFDPLVRSASSVVEQVLDVFNKTLEGDGAGSFFANGLLKGIRNILGGPAAVGAFFALSNIIKTSFSYVAEIAPRLVGITTESSKRRDIEASVLAILQQESAATAILSDSQTNINQKVSNLVGYLTTATAKYEQMVSLSRQLAPLLAEQGISVSSTRGLSANKTKSGGHIPDMVRKAEIQGAFDGGYVPGRVVKSPVGGVMNTAEQVKYYNGFSEPFINPPRNSKAGQNHRTESIKKVGIDPYSFEGFIPNFLPTNILREFRKTVGGLEAGRFVHQNLNTPDIINRFAEFGFDFKGKGPGGYYDRQTNTIYANKESNSEISKIGRRGQLGHVLAHEASHQLITNIGKDRDLAAFSRVLVDYSPETIDKVYALQNVKKHNYPKELYLEEALAEGTLANISEREHLRPFLQLSPKQIQKVNSIYNRIQKSAGKAAVSTISYSDGFIPNFIPTKLLSGYRKVLGKLKDGEFSLENLSSKEVIESFQNEGKTFKNGPGGFYDRRDDGIRVSTAQPKYGQAHVLAHESIHAFLENTGLSEKLEPASRQFARKEPLDVLKNISGVESAVRNNYPKSTYLEEALAEGSLRSSFSKRVLNKYLGLSEKQVFKSNRLYNKLNAASIDAIYSNKAEKSSDGFVPNFAKFLGRGAYGSFFDLEKSVGGARIGKKQFNQSGFNHSFEDDIENEYDISKKLSETQNINPLFGFPKVFGSRERSVAANRIGKEVVDGITVKNIGANSGVPFNKVNDVIDPFRFLLDKEVRDKAGVVSGDLNSNNLIANKPLAGIFEKILSVGNKKPDTFSKFVSRLSYKKGLAEQVSKSLASKGGRLSAIDVGLFEKTDNFSDGFVPNFAYKDSVMKLEQGLSGRRAIFDTNPFPHIRNASQPTFSAAIQDHGGLNNALRDSVLGQKSAGLLNKGFVPNFATPRNPFEDLETVSIKSRSGVNVKTSELEAALTDYIKSVDLVKSNNLQLSPKINKIIGGFELFNDDFKLVRTTAIEFANAQREAALTVAKIKQKSQESGSFKIQPVSGLSPITPAQELTRKTIDISSFGINPPSEEVGKLKQQAVDISNANIAIFQAKQDEIKQRLGYEQAREVGERAELQQQIAQNKLSKQETDTMRRILALEKKKEDAIIKDTSERLNSSLSQKESAALKEQSLLESSIPKVSIYSPSAQNINSQEAAIKLASRIGAAEALDLAEQSRNQSNIPKVSVPSNQNKEAFSRTAFSNFASSLQGANSGVISGGIVNQSISSLSGQTPVFINENQLNTLSSLSRIGIEFGKAGSGRQINSGSISGAVNDLVGNNISANYGINQSVQSVSSQVGGLSGGGQLRSNYFDPRLAEKRTPPKISDFLNQNEVSKTKEKRAFDSGKFASTGLGLAFGAPILAGFAEQALYGNKKRADLTESERSGQSALSFGVTAVSSGAFIGSQFGLPGLIAGTLGGALVGLVKAVDATKLSLAELSDQIDETASKQTNSVKDFSEALSKLETGQRTGNKSLIDEAKQELQSVLLSPDSKGISDRLNYAGSSSEFDRIISDINVKTSSRKGFLSVAENFKGTNKEDSYFDNFKQKTGEAVLNFLQLTVDSFAAIGKFSIKYFSGLIDTIKDTYLDISGQIISRTAGLVNLLISSVETAALSMRNTWKDVSDFILGSVGKGSTQKEKEDRASSFGESAARTSNLFNSLIKTTQTDLSSALDRVSAGAYDVLNYSMGSLSKYIVDAANSATERKSAGKYNVNDLASEYIKFGGAKTVGFLNEALPKRPAYTKGEEFLQSSIFGKSDAVRQSEKQVLKNEQVLSLLSTISKTALSKERESQIKDLGQLLTNRGLDKDQIDAFLQLVEKFSESGNQKGQAILNNFDTFLSALNDSYTKAEAIAAQKATDVINFLQIKKDIEKSVSDYINQSRINEAKLSGSFDRSQLAFGEKQRTAEEFGKPESGAFFRSRASIEKINFETQKQSQDAVNNTFQILDELNSKVDSKTRKNAVLPFSEKFKTEDYSLSQRVSLLDQLNNSGQLSYAGASDKDDIQKRIDASKAIAEQVRISNEESLQTAEAVYAIELKKVQETRSFGYGLAAGFSSLQYEADTLMNKLGRQLPSAFADGLSNAITQAITGAKNIGDALREAAIGFGQQIIGDILKANLYRAIGASGIGDFFSPKQKGGIITAQNGMYISGGRTGDRNLALLEDGEYVLNRNAVKAAGGKGALDQFNFNHAPRFGGRFASGGEFGNLAEIKYATPKGKDAGYDFTNSIITGSNTSQKIDDSNYSAYAYENDQYFIKKREKAVQDLAEKVQRDFVNKQKNAALISTLVGAAGSLTLSAGISQLGKQAALGSQVAQASGKGAITATTPEAQNALTELSNRQLGKFVAANPSAFRLNDASYGTGLNFLAGSKNGFLGFNKLNNLSNVLSNSGFNAVKGSGFSFFGQGLNEATGIARRGRQEGGVIGLNGGGYLPHGSRLGDTIPALLTGGEYVLNNTAVKNNGLSKLNAMNAGVVEGKNSSTTNTNNNATNISINIDRSGKTVVGASTNSYEKQDLILTKDMARSIHAVVLKTISNEKRYNGELYKNPLRN